MAVTLSYMSHTPATAEAVLSDLLKGYVSYFTYEADGPNLDKLSLKEKTEFEGLQRKAEESKKAYDSEYKKLIDKAGKPKIDGLSPEEFKKFFEPLNPFKLQAEKDKEGVCHAYEGFVCKYANKMSGLPQDYQGNQDEILKVIRSQKTLPGTQGVFLASIKDINNKHVQIQKITEEGKDRRPPTTELTSRRKI